MSGSSAPSSTPAQAKDAMPPGIHNVYIFEVFNTASWSIILGSPMLLFLQHLNATATLLALAACLSPVLNILQIPSARFVEPIGYRRFVLAGWSTRSIFVVGMAIIAFLPESMDPMTRILLMLGCSLGFNFLRGISASGLLPWFTHIVPESRRGQFLAQDQLAGALASITCLFITGSLLRADHGPYSFGIIFTMSALCAFAGVYFLRRIPDVPVEKIVINSNPVPWRKMFFYPPFFKYLRYNVINAVALGVSGVFWVRYFKTFLHVSSSNVLYIACLSTIVAAVGLFLASSVVDRSGSKPVLTCSGLLYTCHFAGWGLIAAGILPFNHLILGFQIFTSGLAGALWGLGNIRYVMGIIPHMGRPHFLALYSVVGNLTVGLVPLAWGPVMDRLEHWHYQWGPWQWNCYSIMYSFLVVTMIGGLSVLRTLEEPRNMTWNVFMRELLVNTPSRGVSRVIGRLRGPGIG